MKVRKQRRTGGETKIEIQMTPMIDIVFQLLIFFILTFRIVAQEGDFNIRMPGLAKPQDTLEEPDKRTLRVRLIADGQGRLAQLKLDDQILPPAEHDGRRTSRLHARIRGRIEDAGGPTAAAKMMEVEFECDYNLKYAYVIDAVTAVSGYKTGSGNNEKVVKLIEAIKFAPPKNKPGT